MSHAVQTYRISVPTRLGNAASARSAAEDDEFDRALREYIEEQIGLHRHIISIIPLQETGSTHTLLIVTRSRDPGRVETSDIPFRARIFLHRHLNESSRQLALRGVGETLALRYPRVTLLQGVEHSQQDSIDEPIARPVILVRLAVRPDEIDVATRMLTRCALKLRSHGLLSKLNLVEYEFGHPPRTCELIDLSCIPEPTKRSRLTPDFIRAGATKP